VVAFERQYLPGNMTVDNGGLGENSSQTGWTGRLDLHDRDLIGKCTLFLKREELKDERLSEISDGQRQKAMNRKSFGTDGK